ncbi:hypothetical protein BGZ95_001717, partial [Linnemannia exigua]
MNSDTGYPASSKGRSDREESNMDSGHGSRSSKAEPMRVASMRPTDSEFRVAEREDGGTAQGKLPQRHEPFNASAHLLHVATFQPKQQPSLKATSALKPIPSKALHPVRAHRDPFNAPVHLFHSPGAAKTAPAQTLKLKAAAASKQQTVTPKKQQGALPKQQSADHKQHLQHSQAKDVDHYVHPTPEEEIAQQQHAEYRQRGNSHGHHAIAVPAHRPNKIKEDDDLDNPTDNHNHHRHQCDNDDCSDHDDSHHHLYHSENAPIQLPLKAKQTVHKANKLAPSIASQPARPHHDPFNAPAHLVHAAATSITHAHVTKLNAAALFKPKAATLFKPKAATLFKQQPAAPKRQVAPQQARHQAHSEDIDHYAHPTPEEDIAQQQHVKNRQRGNTDGHHAVAVPVHRDNKIKEDEDLEVSANHHNHHRHQCDDDDCSEHDDSHHHLHRSEKAPAQLHSHALVSQQKVAPAISRPAMGFARPTMSSSMKNRQALFYQQHQQHRQHHHVDPFNAPAHLIHAAAAASAPKKVPIATTPKQRSLAPHPKPFARPLLVAPKAAVKPSTPAPSRARPAALKNNQHHLLHEPFNAPAHLLHASNHNKLAPKFAAPTSKQKPSASHPAESFEQLGRSVGHRGHHPQHHMKPVEGPEYDIEGPLHLQSREEYILPRSWFIEPIQNASSINVANSNGTVGSTPKEETTEQQHAENRQRGNSQGHHAHAVPTHHNHKIPRHPENEDPMDHHNHYRHQYDDGTHVLQSNSANDSPMLNLGSLFSTVSSSGLGDYTYSDAVTHLRHRHRAPAAPKRSSRPRQVVTPEMNLGSLFAENEPQRRSKAPSQPHEHHNRSFGHHGHHAQQDLDPVEGPEYDIAGPSHLQSREEYLLPRSWFNEPMQNAPLIHIARNTPADLTLEDQEAIRHQENRQRGNSHDYTYSEAVTHKRHHHAAAAPMKLQKSREAALETQSHPREHLDRSFGHHGHHPQRDMNPLEAPEYDIEGPSHLHQREEYLLPRSWFSEPIQKASLSRIARATPADSASEDPTERLHQQNRQRGNSHGHHAHAVPAHRDHKFHHQHEYDDAIDKHDHFRHQPHGEDCAEHHDEFGNVLPTAVGDAPLTSLGYLFSAANSSGLGDYTYSEAVTHKRHHRAAAAPKKVQKPRKTLAPSQPRAYMNRSFGHHGHHPQQDLNPVEGPEYDIEGLSYHQSREEYLLPRSWFKEPIQNAPMVHITRTTLADSAPEDPAAHRHQENRQRGNSHGHHAHAVPAHRDHKFHHQHEFDDATDKHDHFRHQPHDENCGEHHDSFGNVLPTAVGDSPLTSLGHLFSAANASGLGKYTYAEAVSHRRRQRATAPHKRRAPLKPKRAFKSMSRPHLGRSFGHHGHHPQKDLNPVEGPEYDIEGPSHHQSREGYLLPRSWFNEPVQNAPSAHIAPATPADSSPEDPSARRHQENRQRGNSHGHHAHAVPTHRDHKFYHQHEYDDATDKHNHFRHQPHDENCGEHHDDFGNVLPTAAGEIPLLSLAHLFSAANSSGLGDYTYAEAVTHRRHFRPSVASKKHRRVIHKPQSSLLQPRQHLGRSYGHRGHHPQHDLNPVERPKYDIVGPLRQHQHHRKRREHTILPVAWFTEPLVIHITEKATATLVSAEEEAPARRHLENKRRGNSGGHHARAVPAHRSRKPVHNHDNDNATDKHDHFRHQPHDESCGTDYHDDLGNLRASAASDSPLLTLRKIFSAANSSCLGNYTYAEAVTHKRHAHSSSLAKPSKASKRSKPRKAMKPASALNRQHLGRSYGHRGHHAQKDLNPVEGPKYDIDGPPKNKRRGNSGGHHARAVPAHRPRKPVHNHDDDDATDKHDHFRHQPHGEYCGTDHHDELGNLRASAASDSPLLTLRKMFSAANSSCLGDYTYAEAVSHRHHHSQHHHARIHFAAVPKSHPQGDTTPEMNLGALFRETDSSFVHQQDSQHRSHDHHDRSFGHHGHHAQQNLNPAERFDYDIEGYQHHSNQQEQSDSAPSAGPKYSKDDVTTPEINIDDWYPEHEPQSHFSRQRAPIQQGKTHDTREHHAHSFGHHGHHAQHDMNPVKRFDYDIKGYQHHPNVREQKDKQLTDGFKGYKFTPPHLPTHGLRTRHSSTDLRQADPLSQYRPAGEYRSPLSQHRPSSSSNVSHSHSSTGNLDIRPFEIRIALATLSSHHASGPSTPAPAPALQGKEQSKKERKLAMKAHRQSIRKLRKSQARSHSLLSQAPGPAPYRPHGAMDDDVYVEAVKQHSKHHAPYPDS